MLTLLSQGYLQLRELVSIKPRVFQIAQACVQRMRWRGIVGDAVVRFEKPGDLLQIGRTTKGTRAQNASVVSGTKRNIDPTSPRTFAFGHSAVDDQTNETWVWSGPLSGGLGGFALMYIALRGWGPKAIAW